MPTIRQGIYDLLRSVEIDTKEAGRTHVEPWPSQKLVIDAVARGLAEDVHEFVVLKCRQVAITTVCSVIELFWALANEGVQGAIIADRGDNLERLRRIFANLLETLPDEWRGPEHRLLVNNRNGLAFANRSVIDLLAAANNPDLGASRALNMMHATECGLWRSLAGVESLKASLARQNPNRLYIYESIANGFNWWYAHCQQAKKDRHMRFIFCGFWSNPTYSIPKSDPDFKVYWDGHLTEEELRRACFVKQEYSVTVKPEQIAWWRRESEGRVEEYMLRHYPWTEIECFIASGSGFFPAQKTLEIGEALAHGPPYKAYRYHLTERFLESSIDQIQDAQQAMLRVWEAPEPGGVYVVGCDPSGGGGGGSDDHAIQVLRCYADRVVQVAEVQTNAPETYQLAWILAHLCGAYQNHVANLEVTGVGAAVMPELRNIRQLADQGLLNAVPGLPEDQILRLIGAVRWFLYKRQDVMGGAGHVINWKCLSLDTPIPTPNGWTTIGAITLGDQVFDELGQPIDVTGVSPIWLGKECFKITFDDGTSIVADAEHRWLVHRHDAKSWSGGQEKIRTTAQLRPKYTIRLAQPLDLSESDLPVHPYTLGLWLGDGQSQQGRYYADPKDISGLAANLTECGETLGPIVVRHGLADQSIRGLTSRLSAAGLLNNKHIPAAYLRASLSQRLALFQGLMDSDGSSGGNGGRQCSFTTSNPQIARSFPELLRTLGYKAKYCIRYRRLAYGGGQSVCEPAWQFWFTARNGAPPVFRLDRKQARIDDAAVNPTRLWHRIVAIEPVPSVPVRCIAVAARSHLYLAGEAMIPTHNTNSDNKAMTYSALRDSLMLRRIEIRSVRLIQQMQAIVEDAGYIGAGPDTGENDDLVSALVLAHWAWVEPSTGVRPRLVASEHTWDRIKGEHPPQTMSDLTSHMFREFFQTLNRRQRENRQRF